MNKRIFLMINFILKIFYQKLKMKFHNKLKLELKDFKRKFITTQKCSKMKLLILEIQV